MTGIADFHFIRPFMLLALLPAIVLLVLLWRSKLGQGVWASVCDEDLLPYLLQEKSVKPTRALLMTGAVAAFLAITALAGPTWQRLPAPAFRNMSALVIALDLSRSMDAQDIKPSRLVRARYKISDLLKQRKDGQAALLVYAGAAFTVTPLTDDTQTIDSQLSALTTGMMPRAGSNTVAVLDQAVALFKQAGLPKGQIVLVTDGVDIETVLPAVNALDGYELSILGVGTPDGAPIPDVNGGFVKNAQGTIIIPKLDANGLAQLAQAGHGVYQTITADDTDIRALLARLGQAVQQGGQTNGNVVVELWDDKGPWLLLFALPLVAMNFRKGVLAIAFCLSIPFPNDSYALGWQDLWQTPDQQAQTKYQRQQFAQSAEQFADPQWKASAYYKAGEYGKALKAYQAAPQPESSDYFYNQANALARSGQLEEALKAYGQALVIDPKNADAQYNRDIVAKALEKQQQEQKKQQGQQSQQKDAKQTADGNPTGDQKKPDGQDGDDSSQKPEPKPERPDPAASGPQQQEKQKPQEAKGQAEKPEPASGTAEGGHEKPPVKPEDKAQPALNVESTEQQQANEQWLKRIPDDPAGLLRRKFKYQYKQRNPNDGSDEEGW
ncbi:VWA domain-containing protein [Methylovulum miyakonense]|uniref:VWA domain-containing protein n=1 Tax=Methylovulum miyakonense TaxID=645578 RepID=UPI0003610931|nr:VWA domain-containing protein [Methylovulum miyakonense]